MKNGLNLLIGSICCISFAFARLPSKGLHPERPGMPSSINESTSERQLVVNGQLVQGKVLEADSRYYIAVEDLAQSLTGSISYTGSRITLSLPCTLSEAAHSNGPEIGTARVRGTLTYYFNANYGNKPDTGASVILAFGNVEIPEPYAFFSNPSDSKEKFSPDEILILRIENHDSRRFKVFRKTVADGNGNFTIDDVPEGNYTLIMQSNHAKGSGYRDALGKVVTFNVHLARGETAEKSYDFGRSFL